MRSRAGLIACGFAVVAAGTLWPLTSAQGADQTAAVVLFYAPSPVSTFMGVAPQEYASEGMSARLATAAAGRLTVVPRDRVRVQESGLRWREADALSFTRLADLAHAAGAGRLVVGWIREFVVERLGGGANGINQSGDGGGIAMGSTVMEVQVFDAAQGRIVYQTQVTGHASGAITLSVAQATLNDAVGRAAALLVGPLTAAAAVPAP